MFLFGFKEPMPREASHFLYIWASIISLQICCRWMTCTAASSWPSPSATGMPRRGTPWRGELGFRGSLFVCFCVSFRVQGRLRYSRNEQWQVDHDEFGQACLLQLSLGPTEFPAGGAGFQGEQLGASPRRTVLPRLSENHEHHKPRTLASDRLDVLVLRAGQVPADGAQAPQGQGHRTLWRICSVLVLSRPSCAGDPRLRGWGHELLRGAGGARGASSEEGCAASFVCIFLKPRSLCNLEARAGSSLGRQGRRKLP